MKFRDYSFVPELQKNIADLGFNRPTDIQFKCIPAIMKGEDVLAIAQTGTGKTAAFAIPILHKIHSGKLSKRSDYIRCLVLVPTRELAQQITGVFEKLGKHLLVKTFSIFGGVEQDPQKMRLEKGIDILVSTPGRMFDLISQGDIRLESLEYLILDEADHMLDLGFIKDIQDLMRHIPKNRQTLFFSATINESIKKVAYSLVRNAFRIQISPKDPVAKNIHHMVTFIEMDDKRFFLARLIDENPNSKILIFVRTKVRAERVSKALERANISSATIHSDKDQAERTEVMAGFRSGDEKILIATDVSARGIDIPDVDIVVNYDLPEVPENYVHRVGRTGRGFQKGKAIAFCSPEEKPVLEEIEKFLYNPIQRLDFDGQEYKDTLLFHDDKPSKLKDLMDEIKSNEEFMKKKGKKK
jgi:ATP-dependent RNA helicase RhlE